jgi:hypothetical protein
METVRIRDPGWKKFGSGIRDKRPGSATLVTDGLGPNSERDSILRDGSYLRNNGAWERTRNRFIDLLSHSRCH